MAWIQSPDGKQKLRIRQGTRDFWEYYKLGWIDVTPPATPKQVSARKRWQEGGDLAATIQHLERLKKNSLVSPLSLNCMDTVLGSLKLDLQKSREKSHE